MKKGFLKYLFLLLGMLIISCDSDNIDWRKTFESDDTIPMGTYVIRKELHKIFPDSKITDIKKRTATFFTNSHLSDEQYFFINNSSWNMSDYTWDDIFSFVNQGGTAFVSTYSFNDIFKEKLEIQSDEIVPPPYYSDGVKMGVKLPDGEKYFVFDGRGKQNVYFSNYNPEYTEILGEVEIEKEKKPNFIKVYYGKGYLLLHTEPVAFTNYEMLKTNHYQYVTSVFSYLTNTDILWDNYRNAKRNKQETYTNQEKEDGGFFSSLSFIINNKNLRSAFLILLGLGLAFLIFNSKRRQRAQQVILPYANHTLDFTKTLAELYRYNSDHTAMTKYKVNYFLEQLRVNYNLSARETESDFSELLSAKTGVDEAFCRNLVSTLNQCKSREYFNQSEFMKIQSLIESFNHKIKLNGRKSAK